MKLIDHSIEFPNGSVFGYLTVTGVYEIPMNEKVEMKKPCRFLIKCQCICGNTVKLQPYMIRSNHTKSCGCLRIEILKSRCVTHSLSKHPLYGIMNQMKMRCTNTKLKCYKNYGGRGISICKEWDTNFMSFYNWSLNNNWKYGLEIDRIDNDGNYSPENCRIVTHSVNQNNKRNNVVLFWEGKRTCISELSKRYNIEFDTLHSRIKYQKLDIFTAINKPLRKSRKITA